MSVLRNYGPIAAYRLIRDVIFTKLFYSSSRIIRNPCYLRGTRHIDFGKGLTTGINLRIDAFPDYAGASGIILRFGNDIEINDYVHIAAVLSVTIGNNVLIASKVFITDHNHGSYSGENQSKPSDPPTKRIRPIVARPVVIEDNVWLGEYATVLPGVTIGKGSVVGALSVVTKDVPPGSIVAGSPARIIKRFNDDKGVWEKV